MASLQKTHYEPLSSEAKSLLLSRDDASDDFELARPQSRWKRVFSAKRVVKLVSFLSIAFNAVAAVYLAILFSQRSSYAVWRGAKELYTPVPPPVHSNSMSMARWTTTNYHGPPDDALDARWEALYKPYLASVVDAKTASKLPVKTEKYPGTELYPVQVDVFRHLECLDMIRKLGWPERYPEVHNNRYGLREDGTIFSRVDQCLQDLRESVTCNAPIIPLPWQFNHMVNRNGNGDSDIRLHVTHTCNDFAGVQKWAAEHMPPPEMVFTDNRAHYFEHGGAQPTHEEVVAAGWELE